jgi:hypothetical protein
MEDHSSHQDINEISSTQRTLEKALSSLTVDVATRFEDIISKQKQINASLGVSSLSNEEADFNSSSSLLTTPSLGKSSMTIMKVIERMNSRQAQSNTPSTPIPPTSTSNTTTPSSSTRTPVDRSTSRSTRIKEEIKRRKSVVGKKVDSRTAARLTVISSSEPSASSEPGSSVPSSASSPERNQLGHSLSQSTCTSPTHSVRAETPFQLSSLASDDDVEV